MRLQFHGSEVRVRGEGEGEEEGVNNSTFAMCVRVSRSGCLRRGFAGFQNQTVSRRFEWDKCLHLLYPKSCNPLGGEKLKDLHFSQNAP